MEEKELTNEECLYYLGYDKRDELFDEGSEMCKFMKQIDKEIKREAQRYMDEIQNNEDDFWLSLKRNENS